MTRPLPLALATLLAGAILSVPVAARAQATCPCPEEPPPGWRTAVGAGFAFTSGNSDNQNVNLSFEVVHDPKKKNVFRADGLWIRNRTDGETSADRSAFGVRDEYTVSGRAFAFGEVRYQRDRFKELSYLVSTLAGLGYRLVDTETLQVTVDGAVGGSFEKLFDRDSTSDGAFKAGQSVSWQISDSAKLTQSAWGLWKFTDTSDSYYHLELALSTSVTNFLEVKLSMVDDYKNKPATAGLEKNDVAFLANLVMKF
jgi:putative salt-induced outer membrane protein YdiY